jgi:hypothetical protein
LIWASCVQPVSAKGGTAQRRHLFGVPPWRRVLAKTNRGTAAAKTTKRSGIISESEAKSRSSGAFSHFMSQIRRPLT